MGIKHRYRAASSLPASPSSSLSVFVVLELAAESSSGIAMPYPPTPEATSTIISSILTPATATYAEPLPQSTATHSTTTTPTVVPLETTPLSASHTKSSLTTSLPLANPPSATSSLSAATLIPGLSTTGQLMTPPTMNSTSTGLPSPKTSSFTQYIPSQSSPSPLFSLVTLPDVVTSNLATALTSSPSSTSLSLTTALVTSALTLLAPMTISTPITPSLPMRSFPSNSSSVPLYSLPFSSSTFSGLPSTSSNSLIPNTLSNSTTSSTSTILSTDALIATTSSVTASNTNILPTTYSAALYDSIIPVTITYHGTVYARQQSTPFATVSADIDLIVPTTTPTGNSTVEADPSLYKVLTTGQIVGIVIASVFMYAFLIGVVLIEWQKARIREAKVNDHTEEADEPVTSELPNRDSDGAIIG